MKLYLSFIMTGLINICLYALIIPQVFNPCVHDGLPNLIWIGIS